MSAQSAMHQKRTGAYMSDRARCRVRKISADMAASPELGNPTRKQTTAVGHQIHRQGESAACHHQPAPKHASAGIYSRMKKVAAVVVEDKQSSWSQSIIHGPSIRGQFRLGLAGTDKGG